MLPDHEQVFRDWPENGVMTVRVGDCTRAFNLDENYSPAQEWRYSQFEIIRRYAVYGDGFVRIEMPDKAHVSSYAAAPPPKDLELTPIKEVCSQSGR